MKRFPVCCFLLLFTITLFAQQPGKVARPKLVVGIVVDQMRWDYLYRFYDRYGANGFRRLLNDGFSCENTMINYLPSYTAPGHSCIYTGSVPSIHGIAGNDWIDNLTGKYWYCTEDTSVQPVGGSRFAGMMSPRNLLASTITDELRLATNFRSRVYGISLKDRGAILPAGHLANGAYWFDDSTGNLISSSYYSAQLPSWLVQFNKRRRPDSLLRQSWELAYPASTYKQSITDKNAYEGNFSGEKDPVFPHLSNTPLSYINLRKIPAGNTYTLEAAMACIDGESLGAGDMTDFLCISLSSTDYIGHQFTPNSVEIEDTYLRLDRDLASFFGYLDKKAGKGNYLVFLSADHGAAHNAEYLNDLKLPAGNENETALGGKLRQYVKEAFKQDSLIRGMTNYQVFFNENKISTGGINRAELRDKIRNWFYQQPEVVYVADMENMQSAPIPEPIRNMAINGYNRVRSGSLLVIYNPGWYHGYAKTGTTHGTWNPYDTHIPLLWYGWNISKGSTNKTVHMEDIAPTLAALLHIQMPNGCIGKVITEVAK